jgi:hypothetical protein
MSPVPVEVVAKNELPEKGRGDAGVGQCHRLCYVRVMQPVEAFFQGLEEQSPREV